MGKVFMTSRLFFDFFTEPVLAEEFGALLFRNHRCTHIQDLL